MNTASIFIHRSAPLLNSVNGRDAVLLRVIVAHCNDLVVLVEFVDCVMRNRVARAWMFYLSMSH